MNHKSAPFVRHFDQLAFVSRFTHGDQASIAEIIGSDNGTQLGAGMARFTNADIPWTVRYDEVVLVLDGEIEIEVPSGVFHCARGDCIWLPEQTKVQYRAEAALVFWAIHPADWASIEPKP